MKNIALIFALVIVTACGRRSDPPNLAVRQMALVDPAATCEPWFTDVGEQHVHTASCTTSGKDVVYIRVEADKPLAPPQMLVPGPATLAKAQEDVQRAKAAAPSSSPPAPTPPPGPPPMPPGPPQMPGVRP